MSVSPAPGTPQSPENMPFVAPRRTPELTMPLRSLCLIGYTA